MKDQLVPFILSDKSIVAFYVNIDRKVLQISEDMLFKKQTVASPVLSCYGKAVERKYENFMREVSIFKVNKHQYAKLTLYVSTDLLININDFVKDNAPYLFTYAKRSNKL